MTNRIVYGTAIQDHGLFRRTIVSADTTKNAIRDSIRELF
jgi:hypothetical protein